MSHSTERATLIGNSNSRRGAEVLRRAASVLAAAGRSVETVDVTQLKELGSASDPIFAVGGDGTVNAAASWIFDHGGAQRIAVVPAGTGNNLAGGLGIPQETEDAVRLGIDGDKVQVVDAMSYRPTASSEEAGSSEGGAVLAGDDTRVFLQVATLGFPATVAATYDELRKWRAFRIAAKPFGTKIYKILAAIGLPFLKMKEWRGQRGLHVKCELPGETIEEDSFAIFLGAERSIGGDFIPCPDAKVDDGLLDICIVKSGTRDGYLKIFKEVSRGGHLALTDTVRYVQTPGPIRLTLSADAPFMADGDIWVQNRAYELEVHPGRFQIVVPG
ncbi:MAG: diacylglycerol kinase family protein [Planctomycetota bacterium]